MMVGVARLIMFSLWGGLGNDTEGERERDGDSLFLFLSLSLHLFYFIFHGFYFLDSCYIISSFCLWVSMW
jgi:hypothetical protein